MITSKILGMVLIIAGTSAFGFIKARHLRLRLQGISSIIDALEIMRGEICTCLTPLPELMERLERQGLRSSHFFGRISKEFPNICDESFSLMWEKALMDSEELYLAAEEKNIICALGGCLGRFDINEQESSINQCISRLTQILAQARLECAIQCKLWSGLGIASGIMISIILI